MRMRMKNEKKKAGLCFVHNTSLNQKKEKNENNNK
jgi:hypothetical protein